MERNITDRGDFIPYPMNRVVGTIADASNAHAAINALLQAGFEEHDIDILHGEAGAQRLDPEGVEHGFFARFQRTLIRTAGPAEEYTHLMRHVEDVHAGRFVIMVLAKQRERRTLAADILNAHGAEFIGFYGRWSWEGLTPDSLPQDPRIFARRAEDIPSLFAQAWNTRNADALASLFDDDAEFVNVTGLWWHDRDAIRTAHAYGLDRIFNKSTLSIDEVRVKRLSDDLAVVHAQMHLSGQTPIGNIKEPGSRTTILSFVVHRADGGWHCASAQNTDVVRGMETNILSEDGTSRSANYRTGQLSG